MAWKYINGHRYYYRAERIGGKVRYRCMGGEGTGEIYEAFDVGDRERREEARDAERAGLESLRESVAEIERPVEAYRRDVDRLVAEHLTRCGYHRHDRGRWRRKRGHQVAMSNEVATAETSKAPAIPASDEPNRLATLMCDVALRSTRASEEFLPAMRDDARRVYDELAGPDPSPIERILAERAMVCWTNAFVADLIAENAALAGQSSIKVFEFRDRMRTRAHNRFLSAVKALADVRKLNLPGVVVNSTGPTQVNVGKG
jgi:hypothetical protein